MNKQCISCLLIKDSTHFYYRKHTGSLNNKCKECVKLESKTTYSNNKEEVLSKKKEYFQLKKTELRVYKRNKCNKDYKENIQYKLKTVLRKRLWHALKGEWKSGSAVKDLGCSIVDFKLYLESKFEPGMNWDNYGKKWQIDHIRPLSSFDLTDARQLKDACNYNNLQPLFLIDHFKKSAMERL
jgi:hypothetical protein